MKKLSNNELESLSFKVREHVIRMSGMGGCFLGASLSCVDAVVYLYNNVMNFDPSNIKDPDRDIFFLSKGHDVPAIYGLFAELGIIEKRRIDNHLSIEDKIYWHPNMSIPGVEYYSGSLGHLPSVSVGVAKASKLDNKSNKIFVLIGDGEIDEGSVWEAMLVAAANKLDNLVFIMDRNFFQANGRTEDILPIEPLEDKFKSFGLDTIRTNGHSFDNLKKAFESVDYNDKKPSIMILDTIRGKGLPSIEERADRWFCNFTSEEVEELLLELKGNHVANLESDTLIVR